jgi:hypothetical protein
LRRGSEGDGEKRGAEKAGPENEAADTKKLCFRFFERSEPIRLLVFDPAPPRDTSEQKGKTARAGMGAAPGGA